MSGCKHWYADLIALLQKRGLLRRFIQSEHLLSDWQLGISPGGCAATSSNSDSDSDSDSDEDEDEDEDDANAETFRASSLGSNHNNVIINLVEQTAVRAIMRRLNEGSRFEKKKCAEDMVRRINRNPHAKEHNAIMGDDTVKNMFEHLYGAIMRRQLPAAIWMALAPFCPSAHRSTTPFPESLIMSTTGSLADSWFFSSTFYRTSKENEKLTDHEKEACESLSLFYNSGKVPRKSETQIIAMVRKHSSNISKLYLTLAKKHPSFTAPIPTDHAFGVCWRGPLQTWQGAVLQKKHMLLMCSLYPGFVPADMKDLSQVVVDCLLKHPKSYWNTIATSAKDIMRGNFYFAQFCGTPPPGAADMNTPYKLWGCITSQDVAPPVRKDYETLAAKSKLCNMLISSAYTLKELLRESFGKKMPELDSDEIERVYKLWHKPSALANEHALTLKKKILQTLRKPINCNKTIRFRGIFTLEGYKRAFYRVEKMATDHPEIFAVVCLFCRTITTTHRLELADLMNHEYIKETMCRAAKQNSADRNVANSLMDYM